MRLGLFALAVVAVVILLRRRRVEPSTVVVAWRDGEEVGLGEGTPEQRRIVDVAERALA
jgi:hypothetical protein